MKVHWKRHAIRYNRLTDPRDPLYDPANAQRYYERHAEEIDFVRGWWVRIRDEWTGRIIKKLWRRYLTNQQP